MLRSLLLFATVTLASAVGPGDPVDWRNGEPQWWHDLKTSYGHQLRKCVFETNVPNSGDYCPGVAAHSDHYYCLYGTADEPTWFCTCLELQNEFVFHCNGDEVMTADDIKNSGATVPAGNNPSPTNPQVANTPAPTDASVATPTASPASVTDGTTDNRFVGPGDNIDWNSLNGGEPQWWQESKDSYGHQLRKCVFLSVVPNTGETCPGVAAYNDHYYCLFGNSVKPTWFCTCREVENDFKFHCNSQRAKTPQEIEGGEAPTTGDTTSHDTATTNDTTENLQAQQPQAASSGGSQFTGGFFAGMAVMVACGLIFFLVNRYRSKKTGTDRNGNSAPDYPEVNIRLNSKPPGPLV